MSVTRIANGTIVDGTGLPAFVGDVFVAGDRVVDVVPRAPSLPGRTRSGRAHV